MIRVLTFGCRFNALESELLRRNAQELGLQNITFINSCAVTAEAERQVRQAIRKIGREQPNRRVIVTGCSAEIHAEMYLALPNVAGVIPNKQKLDSSALKKFISCPRTSRQKHKDAVPVRARAYVAIQNGCDHFCSYCIVTHIRGRSRSVPVAFSFN